MPYVMICVQRPSVRLLAPGNYIRSICTRFELGSIMKNFHSFPQKVSKCISQSEYKDLTVCFDFID